MTDDNVWSDEWGEQGHDWSGGGGRGKPLALGDELGATVYELDPGNFVVYHFHHRWEELVSSCEVVRASGRPRATATSTRETSSTFPSGRLVRTR